MSPILPAQNLKLMSKQNKNQSPVLSCPNPVGVGKELKGWNGKGQVGVVAGSGVMGVAGMVGWVVVVGMGRVGVGRQVAKVG